MKLNNKGFAITSILYGLLLVFVLMVSSYLIVLNTKKNRLDNITQEIDDNYFNPLEVPSVYNVIITVMGSPETSGEVLSGGSITFNGVELNGKTHISCSNGQSAIISGTTVTLSNVTNNTTCNIF